MSVTTPSDPAGQLVERVQDLQGRLEEAGDSATRDLAEELVSAVVQMYGSGLERIVKALAEAGESGAGIAANLAEDPLVATLLFIHDLHPVPLEVRVAQALEQVRPYMESHGGNVELLELDQGIARIRLEGSCSDCGASAVTLELAIKQALEAAAPDLDGLDVEGIAPQAESLPQPESPTAAPAWVDADRLGMVPAGAAVSAEVAGVKLVVANVGGTLLAYRDRCAACGEELHTGRLVDGALNCAHCQRVFFLPRAGRSMDADHLQLEPVPLLHERDNVRVAVG